MGQSTRAPKFPPLTNAAKQIVADASSIALAGGCDEIEAEHVLFALVNRPPESLQRCCDILGVAAGFDPMESICYDSLEDAYSSARTGGSADLNGLLLDAWQEARRLGEKLVDSEHLFLAIANRLLNGPDKANYPHLDMDRIRREVADSRVPGTPTQRFPGQRFTKSAVKAIAGSREYAVLYGVRYISPDHLFLSILRDDNIVTELIYGLGISHDAIRNEIERQIPRGDGVVDEDVRLTTRTKRAIDLAYNHARLRA